MTDGGLSEPRKTEERSKAEIKNSALRRSDETKSRFSHQKRSNFCLPKVTSFFIQAAGLVYHHDAVVDIISPYGAVSHHAPACIPLRFDDMQHFVLVIYNFYEIDDMQGLRLDFIAKNIGLPG